MATKTKKKPVKKVVKKRSAPKAAIADKARILRNVFAGLNGRSSRAGLARSTTLTS